MMDACYVVDIICLVGVWPSWTLAGFGPLAALLIIIEREGKFVISQADELLLHLILPEY